MIKRRLSGIQPSGALHLGNYFGAIQRHIAEPTNAFYFVADLHALNTVNDRLTLERNIVEVGATYLALGLDINAATLFVQSDVPEVTEIAWYLGTSAGKGLLERAHAYKDKVTQGLDASVGLYTYPVLMAADIVAYDTDIVPVGSDQMQHVEMCRDMVASFHHRYGSNVFRMPQHEVCVETPVPGIDGQKMSKSYGNTLPIFAAGSVLKERIRAIKTSSAGLHEPKEPDTVFRLYELVADPADVAVMAERYRSGGYGFGHAKNDLYAAIDSRFEEPRTRFNDLMSRPDDVWDRLAVGGLRAREIARATTDRVRAACGLKRVAKGLDTLDR